MSLINGLLSQGELPMLLSYIGAGADLSLISAAIGLILTLGSSLFFLVLWPLRMAWRTLMGQRSASTDEECLDETGGAIPGEVLVREHRQAA